MARAHFPDRLPWDRIGNKLGNRGKSRSKGGDRMVEKTDHRFDDGRGNAVSYQHEGLMSEDAKTCIDWIHSRDNQGPWLKKTWVSLWFKLVKKKDLSDNDKK